MKKLFVMITMLALAASMANLPVAALGEGAYIVANNTYYVNPDTGISNDGGDTSTGEGMCRNTVYPDSRYEYINGKHYVTIRLKLISFIRDVKFYVQQAKGDPDSYVNASYTVVGENKEENTKDFRFQLPSPDTLINSGFFVGPMNRDVTFFISLNMASAKKDQGAFAAFNGQEPEKGAAQEAAGQTAGAAAVGQPEDKAVVSARPSPAAVLAPQAEPSGPPADTAEPEPAVAALSPDYTAMVNEAQGISEYTPGEEQTQQAELLGSEETAEKQFAVYGYIALAAFLVLAVWKFFYVRKQKGNHR